MSWSYRALFARTEARTLALSCALGWLSFASYGLAIVLAVQSATGSFAVAGASVAAFSLGSALLAPLRGRFVDRRGPRAVAAFVGPHAAGLGLLVLGCATTDATWLLAGAAAVAGASAPPLIATARAVWPEVTGAELVRTGHAVNAALGDAAQVVGPALTGAVAAVASPVVALGLLIPGAAVGACLLASMQPQGARPPSPRTAHGVLAVLRESRGLQTIVICELAIGASLGALDVAASVVAEDAGATELAAIPLAAFAAGSVAASLWSGSERLARAAAWRYVAGSVAVAALLPLCLLAGSLGGVSLVLVAAGAGYGVLNVALFELIEDVVAADRVVEAFTWLTTWAGAGLAAGAVLAGHLGEHGASSALGAVAVPVAVAAGVAYARRFTLARVVRA